MERHTSLVDTGPRLMRRPQRLLSWLLFSLTLAMIASLGLSKGALAAAPPAGTPIGNRAQATYTDATGTTRNATSNLVVTTVEKAYAVRLDANRTQQAGPGALVYFPHTVTNKGNTPDSFTLAANVTGGTFTLVNDPANSTSGTVLNIYADENGDGRPDDFTPISVSPVLTADGSANASFSFVVAAQVPEDTTTAGLTSSVGVTATSVGAPLATYGTDSNTDTVTSSNRAVVNVTKSISAHSAGTGDTITYTLTYYNNGTVDASTLSIADILDSRLTYVPNSVKWNRSAGGPSTPITDTAGALGVTGNGGDQLTFSLTGSTFNFGISAVPFNTSGSSGTTGTISFQVTVNSNAAPGEVTNTATFAYVNGPTLGVNGATNVTGNGVNIVPLEILPDVLVTKVSQDTIASAYQGATIYFHNIVKNEGTGTDTFNVTVNSATSNPFPAGTTFILYKGNAGSPFAASPLLDTNGDTTPDTGPLAVGAEYDIWLQVTLPPYANGGTNYTVDKTATSTVAVNKSDPSAFKIFTDTLGTITASNVTLISTDLDNAGVNSGTAAVVETEAGDPGQTVIYNFTMQNNSAVADNFDLLAGGNLAVNTPLPANATVVFKDSNGKIITNTGSIPAAVGGVPGTFNFTAEVTIPVGAVPSQSGDFYVRAKSPNTGAESTILDHLTVNTYQSVTIDPNHNGQTYPANSIVYVHTVTNHGNVSEVLSLSTGDANGNGAQQFTSLIYEDVNNNGIFEDNGIDGDAIESLTLAPGASKTIFVKVFAPANATPGNMNVSTVTVTFDNPISGASGSSAPVSVTNNTTVVEGQLTIQKTQALEADSGDNTALTLSNLTQNPGEGIWYRIQVTNNGIAPVKNVVVTDVIPTAFVDLDTSNGTTLVDGNPYLFGQGAAWTLNNGGHWESANVASGNLVRFTLSSLAGNPDGVLLPGQTAYMYYSVTIKPVDDPTP